MALQFSTKTDWDTTESALTAAVRQAGNDGRTVIDLTVSNSTRCGFEYDSQLLQPLLSSQAFSYDPDPRGLRSAREAITTYYAGHHAVVDPNSLLLTTSTSEAYSFLFRLWQTLEMLSS